MTSPHIIYRYQHLKSLVIWHWHSDIDMTHHNFHDIIQNRHWVLTLIFCLPCMAQVNLYVCFIIVLTPVLHCFLFTMYGTSQLVCLFHNSVDPRLALFCCLPCMTQVNLYVCFIIVLTPVWHWLLFVIYVMAVLEHGTQVKCYVCFNIVCTPVWHCFFPKHVAQVNLLCLFHNSVDPCLALFFCLSFMSWLFLNIAHRSNFMLVS